MNQYNSYYLYQQFEKRGSQDWLPCYPNIFSVDGDGTMPLVMKKENDPDCGYTGDTEPIYRWYPLPISTDYICDECPVVQYRWHNMDVSTDYYCDTTTYTKYYKQIRQYSYDSGTTWYDVTPPEYQQGSVYEQQSTDCGYVPPIEPQYRTTSGTPYCEGYDKYVDVYSQVSYDGGITWSTTAETPTLVEHNSVECGYIEPQYRTTSGTPYCSGETGYDKYVTVYSQVSYDGGITWETTATTQTLLEHNSADCGYSPKLFATYSNGTTRTVDCDSIYSLGRAQTQPSGMTSAMIGNCTAVVDGGAFSGCSTLTSVTISTGDTTLAFNEKSFINCENLLSIELSNRVTGIYQYSFSGCTSLTGLTIPSSVTSILNGAFSGCTGMTSLVFEQGSQLTALTNSSFTNCSSLTGVTIPSGITKIASAFNGCSSMSSVTFESGSQLEYLGDPTGGQPYGGNTFKNCSSLTGITIPSGVTWIGLATFENCSSLTSIDIPSGVTFIGTYAFSGCTSLTSITVNATTPPTLGSYVFNNTNNCPIYVPCESISLYKSASGWSNYSDRIRGCAEQYRTTSGTPYCDGYDKYVDVYSEVSYDGGSTWETASTTPTLVEHNSQDCGYIEPQYRTTSGTPYCTGVDKYIDVYSQVSYDGGETWSTTATTPTLVERNSQDCGYSPIPAGTKLYISYGNGDVYTASCDSNTTLDYTDTRPSGYQYELIYHIGIGNCITSIGDASFYGCSGITSINIPSGVTSIDVWAFKDCTSLTSIDIPDSVTTIGEDAFQGCSGITSCTIGSGVTSIGQGAFAYCSGLTSVNIPSSVTSIGSSTFFNCLSLTGITVNATTPPTLGSDAMFNGNNCPIYVPSGSVETYKTASGWSDYASRIQAIP